MTELKQSQWDYFVDKFSSRLGVGYNLQDSLKMFLEDYWSEMDYLASQAMDDKYKEAGKYVDIEKEELEYLRKAVADLSMRVVELEQFKDYKSSWGQIAPEPQVPVWMVPAGDPNAFANGFKMTCTNTNANDNARIPGLMPSGYTQQADQWEECATNNPFAGDNGAYAKGQWTEQQLKEWNNIKWDGNSGLK